MDISNFQSSINQKGVLQSNRFKVMFVLPEYLRERGEIGSRLKVETQELLTLRCESATFPGMNITTMEQPRIGYGPLEFMPHNATLDDVTLTFLIDAYGDIHRLFYEWFNSMVNIEGSRGQSRLSTTTNRAGGGSSAPFEVGYKNKYTTDIEIYVYDKYAVEREVMRVTLFKAYPKTLPSINLAWASNDELIRLSVPFTYTDFYVEYKEIGTSFSAGVKQQSLSRPNFQNPRRPRAKPPQPPVPPPTPTQPLDVNPVTGNIERTTLNNFIKRG